MGFRKGRRMLTARNTLSAVALAMVFTVSAVTAGCSGSTAASGQAPVPSFTWKPTATQAVGRVLRQSQVIGVAADDRAFVLAALGPAGNPLIDGTRVYRASELFTSGDDGASWRRVTVPGLTALAQQPVAGYAGRLYLLGEASTQSGTELAMWTSTDGLHWSKPETVPELATPQPSRVRNRDHHDWDHGRQRRRGDLRGRRNKPRIPERSLGGIPARCRQWPVLGGGFGVPAVRRNVVRAVT